jgi:uncharacterized protein (TIGR03492 family)
VRILCLSNGHGEDVIALRILRQLQQDPRCPELAVLPLVGEGEAYRGLKDVPVIGPVKQMPSGGFVYMDGRQLWKDMQGGLLQLTWAQIQTVRAWAKQGDAVLAVGDIVPLLFAWMSGLPYAFVGTAKSEYYLRDEAGWLPRRTWFERFESFWGSVYLPWERWLMGHPRCKAVFPRDSLTAKTLQQFAIPAFDLGNPMMDDLGETPAIFYDPDAELKETRRSLVITLLPGSRDPEAYRNWQTMMPAVRGICERLIERRPVFLAAIAPGLNRDLLCQALLTYGWSQAETTETLFSLTRDPAALTFQQGNATLILSQQGFVECLQSSDIAVAMAGTATEQFIGLGKPAVAIPGHGPQFTPAFAEAQSRLLGPSLTLVEQPDQVAGAIFQIFRDPDRLQLIEKNGRHRMGKPGAAGRIASCLLERLDH